MAYEGSITITDLMDGAPGVPGADGSSVTQATILYYLDTVAVAPVSPQPQSVPWSEDRDVQNQWTKKIPTYVSGATYYVCLESEITNNVGVPTYVYGDAVEDNGLTDAATNSSEAVAISRATRQHFWFVSEKTGTIDAGAYITDTPVDTFKQGKTGGYLHASSTGLTLGKDNNTLIALSGSELAFYRPGTSTIDAKLNSNGLTLTKGGIKAGTVNSSGFVYLSTDNYGSNVTINNHQASNWKQIIGTKFGVDADGNLYAANADISGKITVGAGSNVYTTDDVNPLEIGGRNLFLDTPTSKTWSITVGSSGWSIYDYYQTYIPINQIFKTNDLVTISFDWSTTATSGNMHIECGSVAPWVWGTIISAKGTRNSTSNYIDITSSNTSGHVEITYKITSAQVEAADTFRWLRIRVDGDTWTGKTLTLSKAKAEKGNKATDWTPAPEDTANAYTILWDSNQGTDYAGGEAAIRKKDPLTSVISNEEGWVIWNGIKRPIPIAEFNPNAMIPYNIPIYIVRRLDNANATTGSYFPVWYANSKWNYLTKGLNAGASGNTVADWTWVEATDIVLASCVEPGSEAQFTECIIYDPPYTCKQVTNVTVTAQSAQALANSKKSIHTIDTNYSYSYANILTYSAEGYLGNWAVASTSGVKVGDTVRLKVTVSDMSNAPVYVIGTVTAINSRTELKMTSHGLDTTIIDGGNILTNSIGANQIKANAIDTSKLTIGAQDEMLNSKIEVGGRNILRGTANPTPRGNLWKDFGWYTSGPNNGTIEWGERLPSSPIPEITNGLKLTASKANASFSPGQGGVLLRKGTVTLSAWVKGTAGDTVSIIPVWADSSGSVPEDMTPVNYTIPDSDWHRYEATQVINYDHEAGTATSSSNNGYANAGYVYVKSSTVGRVFYMAGIKLEYGNKATDWTASPDDYVDDADNMLLDWDVPSLTRVKAKTNRYWSDASNTWTTPSFQSLLEPPEEGIKYLQRYVVSTANSSNGTKCLAFYNGDNFTSLPLKLNTPYTVSFWARKTSGSGRARVLVNGGGDKNFDLTSDWKRYTFTFTMATKPSRYYRVWIGSYFPANTTGTVEVCGCKLVAGIDGDEAAKTATSYITNIGSDGIRVHPASTGNNSVLINSDGMTVYKGGTADTDSVAFYGDTARIGKGTSRHVEVKTGGMQVYNGKGDSNMVAHIGYESVQGETGATMGAFFTFGARKRNQTKGEYSVAEGDGTTASSYCSHAEGYNTTASNLCSHAEGYETTASGYCSHAEGNETTASSFGSHAEGYNTTASGWCSHAEGYKTIASGWCSHAGGNKTTAERRAQTAIGECNVTDAYGDVDERGKYVLIVGNGTSADARSNALTVSWTGNVELAIDSSAAGSSTVDGKIMDSLRSLGWNASTEGVIV